MEHFLADLLQDVLGIDQVGVHDNFFELGADSSGAATVIVRLRQALREAVSMGTIFEVPTVAGLAAHLNRHYPDAVRRLCDSKSHTREDSEPTTVTRAQDLSDTGTVQLSQQAELSPRRAVSSRQPAWLGERGVDFDVVEAALLEEYSVEDCVVVARETEGGDTVLVAYVVVSGVFSPERLREHVRASLPEAVIPSVYVSVSGVPLTGAGQVDKPALCRLAVIDDVLMRRWEERLGSLAGVARVVVVSEEKTGRLSRVHLDDLLPERARAPSAAPVASPDGSAATIEEDRPMALADGGQLIVPAGSPQTLTDALLRTATDHAENGVTYVRSDGSETFESYATLLDRARRILAGLQARGLGPGDRAILQIDALEDHYAAFWACVLGGILPATVAVPPSYAVRNGVVDKLVNSWELLGHPPILTSAQLVESVAGLTRLAPVDGLTVLSVDELKEGPPTGGIHHARPDDVAFLQLTSGSTGVPKCIQELHRSVIAHAHAVREFDGHTSDDVTLNWMPVDHVGAMLMYHLKDVYLGCQQVHVKTDLILANPLKWLDLLDAHGVNYTWSPNFAYKLVTDQLPTVTDRSWDLSRIRFFMNAGEQVTLPVIRDFLDRVAPFGVSERAMQPAFGMAETCTRMTCHNHFDVGTGARRFLKSSLKGTLQQSDADDSATAVFIDLGPPIPGVEIRIVDGNDGLLAEGVIGRLQIRGAVVTPGYLDNEAANGEAFVGDGWFNSGDLGFVLDGRLSLTGREKETIIVRGANFYCYEIEDVVNAVEGVEPTFAGACAVADPASGSEGLAVFFVPKEDTTESVLELVRAVRARVAASLGVSPIYVVPLGIEDFPKTTSGKIQRGELKQALETGRFQDPVRPLDAAVEDVDTLPDWFFRRLWRRRSITSTYPRRSGGGKTVLFLDRSGLGKAVAEREDRHGRPCVTVEAGAAFEQLDHIRFRIDTASPGDYRRLLATLAQDGVGIEEVVHLSSYGAQADEITDVHGLEAVQERGACSLLFLLQALADVHFPDQPVRLLVASSHAQPVLPSDGVACEHGPLLGLVRTAPREWSSIDCRHVDLEAHDVAADADAVLHELRAVTADQEVAYRDGRRFIARLERVALHRDPIRAVPFERGGLYLVTGGLGGIASEVAKYLLERHEASLLLVGRTALPHPEAWDTQAHSETVAARIAAYRTLEPLGGDFLYRSADIADPTRMRSIVFEAEARWGRALDGVIHLAGVFEERLLAEETRETFMTGLRPKLQGTWALHELTKDRPDCAFITFSSVNGLFGGFGVGAYCAANSFLDSFAHYRRRVGLPSTCFAWSRWDALGMAPDHRLEELFLARGFLPISAEQGLDSFLAGLQRDHAHLLVGLDAARPHIRRHVEQPAQSTHTLRAYYTTDETGPTTQPDKPQVRDRFGTPSHCELLTVPELPPTDAGTNRTRLEELGATAVGQARPVRQQPFVAPRTALERLLAGSWQNVLRIEAIGIHDNFFGSGGDSIRAAMFLNQLQQALGEVVSMTTVFDTPTIAGLAVYLTQRYPDQVSRLCGAPVEGPTQPGGGPATPEQPQRVDATYVGRIRERIASTSPRQDRRGTATPTNPPAIFVLSPPRSGSTLLRVILGGHPALFAPPELELLPYETLTHKKATLGDRYSFWSEGTIRAIRALRDCDVEEARQTLEDWESEQLTTIQCYRLLQTWMGDRTLVDKTPSYAFSLKTLRRAEAVFEDARYIHLLRHPRAMVHSFEEANFDQIFFGSEHSFSVRALAEAIWLISHQNILEFLADVPAHRHYRLKFEELVSTPSQSVDGLCEFLGLAVDPAMLEPYGDQETRMTDGLAVEPSVLQPYGPMEANIAGDGGRGSRMLGDPKFLEHEQIEAMVAERWRLDSTEDFIGDVTWQLAASLGYARRSQQADPGRPMATVPPADFDEGRI